MPRIDNNKPTLRQRMFARLMSASEEESHEMYRERKSALFSPLSAPFELQYGFG